MIERENRLRQLINDIKDHEYEYIGGDHQGFGRIVKRNILVEWCLTLAEFVGELMVEIDNLSEQVKKLEDTLNNRDK